MGQPNREFLKWASPKQEFPKWASLEFLNWTSPFLEFPIWTGPFWGFLILAVSHRDFPPGYAQLG